MLDARSARSRSCAQVIGALWCMWIALAHAAVAEIRFERLPLKISGMPTEFTARCWTSADVQASGKPDLIVAGTWLTDTGSVSGVLVVREGAGQLKVVHEILTRPLRPTDDGALAGTIEGLTSRDIDNDGTEELFTIENSVHHRMARWSDDSFTVAEAPFSGLMHPVIAWLDYDGDGWTDLYLSGGKTITGQPRAILQVPGRIYHNEKGRFVETSITVGDDVVDSAHVLDFDADGKPDILLTAAGTSIAHPRFTRIFINRVDRFEEVESPLRGTDKLVGLDSACLATGDFDQGGPLEILMAGNWAPFVAKSTVTLLYTRQRKPQENSYFFDYDLERMRQLPDINGEFTLADLDGDGDIDILAAGRGRDLEYRIMCLENTNGSLRSVKTGPWKANLEQPLGGTGWTVIPWDVDENGLLDILALPLEGKDESTVLLNKSNPHR